MAGGYYNGKIYLVGGYADGYVTKLNTLYDYDIVADSWTRRAPLPVATNAPGAAIVNGRLWVIGGGAPSLPGLWPPAGPAPGQAPATLDGTWLYNPATDTWSTGPRLNQARWFPGSTTVGQYAVVFGGLVNGDRVSSVETAYTAPCDTPTPTPTLTPTDTPTPTSTPVNCQMNLSDVTRSDYYYEPVYYLYCRNIVSGYADQTFRPFNNTTRSQFAKILVLGRAWPLVTPATTSFNDVPAGSPFFAFVETAYAHGVITGYDCGTRDGEPCPGRYFRPATDITRGQISKLIALAMAWSLLRPTTPTFQDVPASHPFYQAIETSYAHNVIAGYDCGAGCRSFRPAANATRAQLSKMLWIAITHP